MSRKKTSKMREFSSRINENKDKINSKKKETEEFRSRINQYETRRENEEKEEQRRRFYQKNIKIDCKLERDSYTSDHDLEIFE